MAAQNCAGPASLGLAGSACPLWVWEPTGQILRGQASPAPSLPPQTPEPGANPWAAPRNREGLEGTSATILLRLCPGHTGRLRPKDPQEVVSEPGPQLPMLLGRPPRTHSGLPA